MEIEPGIEKPGQQNLTVAKMHRISRAKLAINHFPIFRSILPAKAFSSRAKRKFFSLSSSPRYREAAFTITHLVDVMRQMPTPPFPFRISLSIFRAIFVSIEGQMVRESYLSLLDDIKSFSSSLFMPFSSFLEECVTRIVYQLPYWNQCKYFTCTCTYISSLRDYIHMSDYMHMQMRRSNNRNYGSVYALHNTEIRVDCCIDIVCLEIFCSSFY